MKRWIKVPIKTMHIFKDKNDYTKCFCQWVYDTDTNKKWCKIYNVEINNNVRCQACIDADITDKMSKIEELEKQVEILIGKISPCIFGNENCYLNMNEDCEECIETWSRLQAQKEIESEEEK